MEVVEEKLRDLGFTSEDTANIISGNIDLVKEKYKKLDMQQITNLQTIEALDAAQKQAMINMLESSKQATEQLIEDTKARIEAIQEEIKVLLGKNKKLKNYYDERPLVRKSSTPGISDMIGFPMLDAIILQGFDKQISELDEEIKKEEDYLKSINESLENINNLSEANKKSSESLSTAKDQYKAEVNRYATINLELDRNNNLLQKNKTLQELAGNDLEKKIPLMEEQIKLEKEQQNLLHQRANIYRQELVELEKTLGKQNFKFSGEGDNRIITNLDNIKGKTEKVEKQFKRYIELQSNLIPQAKQEWLNLSKSIQGTGESMQNAIRDSMKELIELEKRNAYMDLDLRQRKSKEQLDRYKARLERDVAEIEDWIKDLQSEIDGIQESERARQETKERKKYLDEISKLEDKYFYLQYINLANISEEQAKLVGLEKEREQYLERQIKLQELQIKLENVRREKNIQQLTKNKDGTFDFTYFADEKEIDNINKQIEDLQREHSNYIKNLKEQTLEDLKRAQENYDEWEYQNDLRRQIEDKQRRIQEYQDEIADLQQRYAEKERLASEAFARERQALDDYYIDINILTDDRLKALGETYNENWSAIVVDMKDKFAEITSAYLKMVKTISGGGGGGSSGGGSTSSSPSSYSKGKQDAIYALSNKHNVDLTIAELMHNTNKNAGFNMYHEGGIVGDKTRELPEMVNKLFNAKPNEQIIKALKGELFIPEENVYKNFLPNMSNLIKSTIPKVPLISAESKNVQQPNVIVEKVVLPNVQDFEGFKKALINLPNIIVQEVKTVG